MNDLKIVEMTDDVKSEYDHYSDSLVIKNAKRKLVKHYTLCESCENKESVIKNKIQQMVDAQWWNFNSRFEELNVSNGQTVKVLTCAPLRFNSVNTEVDCLKPFIFTYQNDDGYIDIYVEMNYSFEIN